MKYLVITPTVREYHNMVAALDGKELQNSYSVVRCGVGKAMAAANTALAIKQDDFDRVAVVGYAASSLGRERGQIVAPRVARYHD